MDWLTTCHGLDAIVISEALKQRLRKDWGELGLTWLEGHK